MRLCGTKAGVSMLIPLYLLVVSSCPSGRSINRGHGDEDNVNPEKAQPDGVPLLPSERRHVVIVEQ